jgi:hypothetical protein
VQIVQGSSASTVQARINGDILFDENSGPLLAKGNAVGGSLQAFKNTGSGNTAASKEDQCSRL